MTNSLSTQDHSTKVTTERPLKKDAPEFLLVMVISFILWAIGLVDLLTHTSNDPDASFIGPYTRAITFLIAAYFGLFLVWLGLLVIPRSHLWIQDLIRKVQARLWLVVLAFSAIGVLIWSLFRVKRWEDYPGVGLAFFCLLVLLGIVLLVSGWRSSGQGQRWRKVIAVPLALCLLVEGGTQVAAYAELLPPVTINSGLYVPSGRVYQNEQGFANGRTNSNGWYYPEFRLNETSRPIVLLGDTFLQGLQVDPQENMGVLLGQMVEEAELVDSIKTDVIALGMPGFGPGLYLSETRLVDTVKRFRPKEIILLFHLSNDFQVVDEPSQYELYFEVNEEGVVDIHDEAWDYRHNLQHLILHGYEQGLTPLKTLATHMLAPKVIRQVLRNRSVAPQDSIDPLDMPRVTGEVLSTRRADATHIDVTEFRVVDRTGASNFLFEQDQGPQTQESYDVALGLLRQTNNFLKGEGVVLRIVTIPAFPPAFFDRTEPTGWSAALGPYDLFLPERKLAAFAAAEGIDFLAMGQTMQRADLSTDQIKGFYFDNGRGHFTAAGHEYMAERIFDCFIGNNRANDGAGDGASDTTLVCDGE